MIGNPKAKLHVDEIKQSLQSLSAASAPLPIRHYTGTNIGVQLSSSSATAESIAVGTQAPRRLHVDPFRIRYQLSLSHTQDET